MEKDVIYVRQRHVWMNVTYDRDRLAGTGGAHLREKTSPMAKTSSMKRRTDRTSRSRQWRVAVNGFDRASVTELR
jgi:hypothetical protein